MSWTPKDFSQYCCTIAYHDDYGVAFPITPLKSPNQAWSYDSIRAPVNGSGKSGKIDPMILHELHRHKT
jgi:hypothetical protein